MTEQRFGGPWTEEKLSRLKKYLRAYMKIFSRNPRAAYFRAVYVDAFAGTGFRKDPTSADEVTDTLFEDVASDTDADALRKGSAQVALETEPSFAEYVFIEHAPDHAQKLSRLRSCFPALSQRIRIVREDANEYLKTWCAATDWNKTRAVVFLDPYGMQVEWTTIAAMGPTQGIDLWILFPLGVGVNRLLLKGGPPRGPWADRLTRIFGTDAWRNAFYRQSGQQKLFGGPPDTVKDADFKRIAQLWVDRLKTVFPEVAPIPLPLRNSKNVPIYLLSFAAANPRGGKTAVKIAQDILSR
jgi:three-Cys-motif partner protein